MQKETGVRYIILITARIKHAISSREDQVFSCIDFKYHFYMAFLFLYLGDMRKYVIE